jgi:Family of unknown function (DUF5996)
VHANRTCCRQLEPHRHVARASRFRVSFVAGSDDQLTPTFTRSRRSPMRESLFVGRSTFRAVGHEILRAVPGAESESPLPEPRQTRRRPPTSRRSGSCRCRGRRGAFDLALTLQRAASSEHKDTEWWVLREANSHEEISVGFWPGSGTVAEPAFYAYTRPEPPGVASTAIRAAAAFYSRELGDFILPYDMVRSASSPDDVVLDFYQTYDAGAGLARWDRTALDRPSAEWGARHRSILYPFGGVARPRSMLRSHCLPIRAHG